VSKSGTSQKRQLNQDYQKLIDNVTLITNELCVERGYKVPNQHQIEMVLLAQAKYSNMVMVENTDVTETDNVTWPSGD
jgi:hypothetical protein